MMIMLCCFSRSPRAPVRVLQMLRTRSELSTSCFMQPLCTVVPFIDGNLGIISSAGISQPRPADVHSSWFPFLLPPKRPGWTFICVFWQRTIFCSRRLRSAGTFHGIPCNRNTNSKSHLLSSQKNLRTVRTGLHVDGIVPTCSCGCCLSTSSMRLSLLKTFLGGLSFFNFWSPVVPL